MGNPNKTTLADPITAAKFKAFVCNHLNTILSRKKMASDRIAATGKDIASLLASINARNANKAASVKAPVPTPKATT